jgi:hypothetical protein
MRDNPYSPTLLICSLILAMGLVGSANAQTTFTLFNVATPGPQENDTNSVSLGVQWRSTQPGTVKGIRFYRIRSSTGYAVALYDGVSRARLATKSVTNEPCGMMPCWEEIDFPSPVPVVANRTYIATYHAKGGNYASSIGYFANQVTNGPLTAPASAQIAGGNGVYHYGTSITLPDSTYQASNYWVDVVFTSSGTPPPPPTLSLSVSPPSPSLDPSVPPGTLVSTLTATWSDGSPFTGTYIFGQPDSNDGGLFSINGNTLVTAGSLAGDANTVQKVTVGASQ